MDNLGYLGALCGRFADARILDGCEPGVPRNRRLDPGRRWPPPASSRIQGPGPGKEVWQGGSRRIKIIPEFIPEILANLALARFQCTVVH